MSVILGSSMAAEGGGASPS